MLDTRRVVRVIHRARRREDSAIAIRAAEMAGY